MAIYTPYMPEQPSAKTVHRGRAMMFLGILAIGLLFGGVGAWATLAPPVKAIPLAPTFAV